MTALGEWTYINTITAPPATGQVRLNNAVQNTATHIWINKTDATGILQTALLMATKKGHELTLQGKSDSTKWQSYTVTVDPVDAGTYIDFTVTWLNGGVDLPQQRLLLRNVPGTAPVTKAVPYAYPSNTSAGNILGLTVRQYYASQAMIGFMSGQSVTSNLMGGKLAEYCFKLADSLMEFEEKELAGHVVPPVGG